jgi:hypothetical protein
MRNLVQYPISLEEEIKTLRSLAEDLESEKKIGDLRPAILRSAANRIERSP